MNKTIRDPIEAVPEPFIEGSAGSRLGAHNIRKYEQHNLNENAPSVSDHAFESLPIRDNSPAENSPEMVRRRNNHARDCATGFDVQDNEIYARS